MANPGDIYGYEEALHARMHKFDVNEVQVLENEYEDEYFAFPEPPLRYHVSTVHLDAVIEGHSLSGELLFQIPQTRIGELSELTAGVLLELLAEQLETAQDTLKLIQGEHELSTYDRVSGTLTLQQTIRDHRPLVCRKVQGERESRLGEGSVTVDMSRMQNAPTIQALVESREWVTGGEEDWLVYTKLEVLSYTKGVEEVLKPIGYFPLAPCWKLPAGSKQWGGERSDVWSTRVQLPVKQLLDEHAAATLDRPLPRYQMIVDPNQFVDHARDGPVWVPCEFDIAADGTPTLVGGMRSHQHPHLAQHVALPVLSAALPLLAKLRRPQLLLDERRLQVVFKAQSIIVPGAAGDGADSEYVGLWHVDGHREHVAAVVLYYYDVDPCLHGGDMEFCGREPMDVLGVGDCSNNVDEFSKDTLRAAFRGGAVHNCRVPIAEGTLLVFSNYQMAHRVLRLANTGPREASRDFVALFILDPSMPPLRPARSLLAGPYLLKRTLARTRISASDILRILEFSGATETDQARKAQRNQLLSEQLKPSGEFALGSNVYATGNGCYAMIGWLHKLLEREDGFFTEGLDDIKAIDRFRALNLTPLKADRGMSEVLSLPTEEIERRLKQEDPPHGSDASTDGPSQVEPTETAPPQADPPMRGDAQNRDAARCLIS